MGLDARLLTLNRSQEDLEAELLIIQNELMGGKTVTSWSIGESSAQKNVWLSQPPSVRLRLVAEALSVINPTLYPPDLVQVVTQTKVQFT